MVWVLAISVALLGYVYAGYPVVIWFLARVGGRPVRKGRFEGGVAVLIAAHNEAETLPRKLENLRALAEDEPIREIWIGLDGCTDGTGGRLKEGIQNSEFRIQNARAANLQPSTGGLEPEIQTANGQHSIFNVPGEGIQNPEFRIQNERAANLRVEPVIHVLELEARRGKAAVLNDLMAKAGQSVFVMMDARQRVEKGAISRLLENFADETVGVVSGALVYEPAEGSAPKGADSYWGYEKFIRRCESRRWAVPGATGALYAIRRELCQPIPENTLVDDVLIPMRAVLKGYRCLFEPAARVWDRPSDRQGQEVLRKRRTLAGIWQMWSLEPRLFSCSGNPIWFEWVSHKFLRLWTPGAVLLALVSLGGMAWEGGGALKLLFAGACGVLGTSFLAYWGGKWFSSRLLGLLGAFFGVNWALLQAAGDAWTGRFEARWKRGGEPGPQDRLSP